MSLYNYIFADKEGRIVVWQYPNWPLLVSAAAYGLDLLTDDDLSLIGELFLFYWAVLELLRGVNIFRRLLGASVLAIIFWQLF